MPPASTATAAQIEAAAALPYVAAIDLVRQSGRSTVSELRPLDDLERVSDKSGDAFAYGPGRGQLALINVPPAHAQGLTGAGVVIAIFDTGFDVRHDCFDDTDIVATWNFLERDVVCRLRRERRPVSAAARNRRACR